LIGWRKIVLKIEIIFYRKKGKMNKSELISKELGMKGVSSKTKDELLIENTSENVLMKELLSKTPKDKPRKVCKKCHELGHNSTSTFCKINIDKHNRLKEKIKTFILSQSFDKTIEDYCLELSVLLDITPNLCKSLYNEIPLNELLYRQMDISYYLTTKLSKQCHQCNKTMWCIQTNTHRMWKGVDICDTCWCSYQEERDLIWKQIRTYKNTQCEICSTIQTTHERFHYDHLNMFHKGNSICSMVNDGETMKDIYSEIDKCHILCLPCHHLVTDIEHKCGFTRIKQTLTRKLNQSEITQEEYDEQTLYYQKIYEEKMNFIYEELKQIFKFSGIQ
jgi:hypothetical protein